MYLAIDIGGTNSRIAASTSLDQIELPHKTSWQQSHNFEIDYKKLIEEIKKISPEITAIGIGIPGDLTPDKKIVYSTTHNHELENKPLVDILASEFSCPVLMDNDAVSAALGIAYFGQGIEKEFAYVTWGTGIGGALVKIAEGKPQASQLNWEQYFKVWEDKCGGEKLEKRFQKTADQLTDGEWQEVIKDFESGLKTFQSKVNQELIIFGGGISFKQGSRLGLNISTLGEDTGLYGGFGLIKSMYN